MTLKSNTGTYLLKGVLNHKEEYDLGGHTIYIAKEYENNLLKRNCQLAYIMGVPKDNPLELEVGDKVFVHHMIFFGEIGSHSKEYTLQDHAVFEGEKLFRCEPKHIYVKIKNGAILSVGDNLLMERIEEDEEAFGLFLGRIKRKDIATLLQAKNGYEKGDVLLVASNALYPMDIDKHEYLRLKMEEVMGKVDGDTIIPNNDRIVVKDVVQQKKEYFIDLPMDKGDRDIKSEVIAVGDNVKGIEVGDIVLRRKTGGVKFKDCTVITMQGKLDDDSIFGVIQNEYADQ